MLRPLLLFLLCLPPWTRAAPLWIAVGYQGRRLVSHDGREWREVSAAAGAPTLRAIACEGGRFIAVGGSAAAGLALTTLEGEHWQEWPAMPGEIETITAGQGRFVAVRGGELLTTTGDAPFRAGAALPFEGEIHARQSACGDTEAGFRFAVIGQLQTPAGPVPWRAVTEDGLRWDHAARDTPPARALAHGAGLFVVAGPDSLLETSHDGEIWTRRELAAPDDIETLLWTGTQFIAQGKLVQTSADGFTWRREPEPAPGQLLWSRAPHPVLALSWSQQMLSGNLRTWTPLRMPAGMVITGIAAREE